MYSWMFQLPQMIGNAGGETVNLRLTRDRSGSEGGNWLSSWVNFVFFFFTRAQSRILHRLWLMEPTISWGFIINKRLDSVRDLTRRSHSSVSRTMPGIIRFNKHIFIIIIPWRTQEMLISCMWLPKWRIYCDMLHLGWVGLRRPVDALHNIYQADSQQSPLFIWFAFVFWSLSTHNKLLHKRVNNQTAIIGFRGDKTAVDSGWINRQFN